MYQTIFENISDGLVVYDPETGEIHEVNESFCKLKGDDRDELVGTSVDFFDGPDFAGDTAQPRLETVRDGTKQLFDAQLYGSDGTLISVEVHLSFVTVQGQERVLASVRDLSEGTRRRGAYEQIFNGVHDPITVHDPETAELLEVNDAFCDLLGYSREEILDMGITGYSVDDGEYTLEQAREFVDTVLETGEPQQTEWAVETSDGDTRWLEVKGTTVEIDGEVRYVSIDRDVTEQRRREREYEQIFNNVNDVIAVHDPRTGEMLSVNETMCTLTGYDRERLLELGAEGLTVPTDEFPPDRVPTIIDRVMSGEEVDPYEQAIQTAEGTVRWLEVNPTRAVIDGEDRFLAISRDVTERRTRQQRLEAERDRRSVLFENTPDPIMAVEFRDTEPYITEVNSAFENTFGFDADTVSDRPIDEVIVPDGERDQYEQIREQALAGDGVEAEVKRETADGVRDFLLRVLPFESGDDTQAYVWYTDVTERRERERAITRERDRRSVLFENNPDPVLRVQFDGDDPLIREVNSAFEGVFGFEADTVVDSTIADALVPDGEQEAHERYRTRAARGETIEAEAPRETADGIRQFVFRVIQFDAEDEMGQAYVWYTDVSDRRRREQAIETLQDATGRMQRAETREAVADIAVDAARNALNLPVTMCWLRDDDTDRLEPVSATEQVHARNLWSPLSVDRYEYDVFEDGSVTPYSPREHGSENTLYSALLLPLGKHGLLAAGRDEESEYDAVIVDVARTLAEQTTNALNRVERAREVRQSERRMQAILDRIDEAIFLAPIPELEASDLAPDFVSSGYADIWGQSLDGIHETYENGFFDTVHPDDFDEYVAFIQRILRETEQGEAADSYDREYRIERPDGDVRWIHSDFYPTEWTDGPQRIVIASRDITDRKQRERTLESFHDATAELTTADTVAAAGQIAVEAAAGVFELPATAVYRYDEETGRLEPSATGPGVTGSEHLQSLSATNQAAWDVFVEATMDRVSVESEPALQSGPGDEALLFPLGGNGLLAVWRSGDTFDTDAASILAATLEASLNRLQGERQVESRQEELEAHAERARRLESITELTQRVEAAITTESSRQGIQDAVCAELTDVEPFGAAWITEAEVGTDRLSPRAVAGIDRDEAEMVVTGDSDGTDPHPGTDVWQTGEAYVVNDLVSGGRRNDWRRRLLQRGAGSVCAVALAYGGVTHGVLTVVADEPDAFDERAIDVLSQLGTSIGYAITAIERQRALESDDTLELEFEGTDVDLPFARLSEQLDCRVRHERTVRRQDGSVSVYYTLAGDIPESVAEPATDVLSGDLTVVSRQPDEVIIEQRGSSWFGSFISEYGGVLRQGRVSDSGVSVVIELPNEADTRTMVERVEAELSGLELTAQRHHRDTEVTTREIMDQLDQRLTDRQYEALETAHAMGYFAWPRESSGEAVAETLNITQPTVNKHIRLGENKVFSLLFESATH